MPALVVSFALLPLVIVNGHLWPYDPNTVDLKVYRLAVEDMVNGRDIYLTSTPGDNLKFIYPPIAAVLMTPLLIGPLLLWQVLWTVVGTGALLSVLRRIRVPRGILLGVVAAALVLAMEPIRTTMGYGQVNTMLMALVVADLLPDEPDHVRRVPRGALIGLAAAIKLTPLLFVVLAFLIWKRRVAVMAMVSFLFFTAVAWILLPKESLEYWRGLGKGEVNTAGPVYVGNQGISGAMTRWFAEDRKTVVAALAIGFLVALIATAVAAWWWRRGEKVFAVGLVGLATCLASPLSWTHHHVWAVILLVAVAGATTLPAWAVWTSRAWAIWIALCLPLAILPYGGHVELSYTAGQKLVGNLGPTIGTILILTLAVHAFVTWRRERITGPAGGLKIPVTVD
ncbi:MAG TPA: glycosyltransferase 87 family protein [Propionibacteriaceae bacterium]|nr:glycosyltransferase 87 family protein [Propionibacteriaceae bacterium]